MSIGYKMRYLFHSSIKDQKFVMPLYIRSWFGFL